MALADTANLIVKLSLKDEGSGPLAKFMASTDKLKIAMTAAGAAVGAMGIAGLRMGDDYDEALDSIRTGTGQTGTALGELEQSFKNVAGTVKEDIGLTAQVMADLSTRTGLTGGALEDMTQRVIEFSRVTGTDAVANTANITRLFGDWSVATEDQSETMDQLLRASQATGLGVDDLMQTVVQFGAPLRLLGFEMEESIALLGKWEKEGVNTETMLTGLKFSVKTLAAEGVPAAEMADTLREKIAAIGTSTDPVSEAIKLFGLRAGPDLAAAILEGRFSVDDLIDTIKNGSETVKGAVADTRDFGDGIAELKNKIKLAIGPIMDDFSGLAAEMGNAIYLLPVLGGALGRVTAALWLKVAALKASQGGWTGMLKAAGPAVGVLGGVGAALYGVNEGLNLSNEKGKEAIAIWDEMTAAEQETAASTEILGMRFDDITQHFANFTGFVAPWHEISDTAAEMAGRVNNLTTETAGLEMAAFAASEKADEHAAALLRETLALQEDAREMQGFNARLTEALSLRPQIDQLAEDRRESMRFAGQVMQAQGLADAMALGQAIPGEIGKGLADQSRAVLTGAETLRNILENGLTPEQQAMEAIGSKYVKLLQQGIQSEIPGAKQTALELAIQAINTIEDAGLTGAKGQRGLEAIGVYYDQLLASGMSAQQAETALTAAGVSAATLAGLNRNNAEFTDTGETWADKVHTGLSSKPWEAWGDNVGTAWGRGVARGIASMRGAIEKAIPRGPLEGMSPPREGPLRDIDTWGFNIGRAWFEGVVKGIEGDVSEPIGRVGKRLLDPKFKGGVMPVGPIGQIPRLPDYAGPGRRDRVQPIVIHNYISSRDIDGAMEHRAIIGGRPPVSRV